MIALNVSTLNVSTRWSEHNFTERFKAVAITLNVSTRWSVHDYSERFNAVVSAWLH